MENTDAKATLDRLKVLLFTQVFRGDQGRRVIEYLIGEYGASVNSNWPTLMLCLGPPWG